MHIDDGALVGAVIGSVSILPVSAGDVPFKAMAISIIDADDTPALTYQNYKFIQTEELTALGVAVHPYGGIVFNIETIPGDPALLTPVVVEYDGTKYAKSLGYIIGAGSGTPLEFEPLEDEGGGGGDNND